jgi:hypothetical protein
MRPLIRSQTARVMRVEQCDGLPDTGLAECLVGLDGAKYSLGVPSGESRGAPDSSRRRRALLAGHMPTSVSRLPALIATMTETIRAVQPLRSR